MNNNKPALQAGLQERIAVAVAFVLPLAFWPPAALPFSTAKEWLLAGWVLIGFVLALATGAHRRRKIPVAAAWAAGIWILVLSISAGLGSDASLHELWIAVLPCAGFILMHWVEPRTEMIFTALAASGTVIALIAVLQFLGLDPFPLIGLSGSLQGNSRIRVFSTMGNPNFVAAILAAVLPLTVLPHTLPGTATAQGTKRFWLAAAGILQACGIFATGSRAPILAFLAVALWLLIRTHRQCFRFFLPGLIVCSALVLFSPARPLPKTIEGRLHIWRLIGGRITAIPPTGYGPGAFVLQFARWQSTTDATDAVPPVSFAGLQDHAHNDYLEFLVDLGFIGLIGFGIVTVWLTDLFRSAARPQEMAATSSLIALLSVAAVDFPLHRPAELYVFWTALALLSIARCNAARTGPILHPIRQHIGGQGNAHIWQNRNSGGNGLRAGLGHGPRLHGKICTEAARTSGRLQRGQQ